MFFQLIITHNNSLIELKYQHEQEKLLYIADYLDMKSLFLSSIQKYRYRIPLAILTGESLIYAIERLTPNQNNSFYCLQSKQLGNANYFNFNIIFENPTDYWGLLFASY